MIHATEAQKTPRQKLHQIGVPTSLPRWEGGNRPDGSSWEPVNHGVLADAICESIEDIGLEIVSESWNLCMKGNVGLIGGVKVKTPNKDIAESIGFDSSLFEARGMDTTIVCRHSNNGRWALQFLTGAEVKVCTNGAIWGKFGAVQVKKKHSLALDIKDYVGKSILEVSQNFGGILAMQEDLESMDLALIEGDHLLVEAMRSNLITSRMMPDLIEEWRNPRHQEFRYRNAWSLYNCTTEIAKCRSPKDQIRTIGGMSRLLIRYGQATGQIKKKEPRDHVIEVHKREGKHNIFTV